MLSVRNLKGISKMNKDCDIILMGLFKWDGPYSSISIAMAKEFAKRNRLFYVNHPYSYKDYYVELKGEANRSKRNNLSRTKNSYKKDEKVGDNFVSVTPPLTYPINSFSKGSLYNYFFKKNQKIIAQSLEQLILDHNIKDYILLNCYDPFFGHQLPKTLQPALNIYQSVDDISQDEYTAKHGLYLEEEAIKKADLTLVTSSELLKLKSPFTNNIHTLNNAVDIAIFEKALFEDFEKPEELKSIKGPIIGYIGNLDSLRVDYNLIKKVAESNLEKNLVFIGPINNTEYKEIGLDKLKNVHFLGKRPIEALPPYLKQFDCAIIPFQCNTLTRSIYPLKINEYLAAGKPVIATNFSKDIRSFKEHIYLSETEEDFIKNINKALAEDNNELAKQRHQLASSNTWSARIEQFWKIVEKYMPEKATN